MSASSSRKGNLKGSAKQPRWAVAKKQFSLHRADGVAYLERWWIVATPWGGVALHRIRQPDLLEYFHDHEASFVSVVLRGGYTERILCDDGYVRKQHITRWNRVDKGLIHELVDVDRDPTWTLMFVGKDRGRL